MLFRSPHYEYITLIWHGGEPLLMGIDFYIQVCNIIDKFKEIYGNKSVKMIFQTNSLLINHEWINFFNKHHIHVGTSFDGVCNELTRGNTQDILNVFKLMQEESFPVSAISVVTSQTLPHLLEDYHFYKKHKINIKFNPVFKTDLTQSNEDTLLTSESFIKHMLTFLSTWFYDTNCNIAVEPFIDFCLMSINKSKSCSFSSCLLNWLCVDWMGNITPCGRNFPEEYNMGNVHDYLNIQEAFYSNGYLKLLKGSVQRRAYCKINCPIFDKCHGGCSNDALIYEDITKPDIFYCKYVKAMLAQIDSLLENYKSNNINVNPYVENIFKQVTM